MEFYLIEQFIEVRNKLVENPGDRNHLQKNKNP